MTRFFKAILATFSMSVCLFAANLPAHAYVKKAAYELSIQKSAKHNKLDISYVKK